MALHRDIFWVGRQWAVTGYGIQACNQKQKGQFDIEGSRLWEDGVQERLRAEAWLNIEDFEKALEVARKYYPEPPRKPAPVEPKMSRFAEGRLEGRARKGKSPSRSPRDSRGAGIRTAHRKLAREIRADVAHPHSALIALAAVAKHRSPGFESQYHGRHPVSFTLRG